MGTSYTVFKEAIVTSSTFILPPYSVEGFIISACFRTFCIISEGIRGGREMTSYLSVFTLVEVSTTCCHGDSLQPYDLVSYIIFEEISHNAKYIYYVDVMNLTEEAACQSGTTCVAMTTCSSLLRSLTHQYHEFGRCRLTLATYF